MTKTSWDAPKSQNDTTPSMPWALVYFTIKQNGNPVFHFYLNFN